MGKKNKKKVSGAEKTAAKTEKKIANKLKKEIAEITEEDIEKVVAQIERDEAKKLIAFEKPLLEPPSPRACASLTPHPNTNELILFGGEFHNGRRTEVYNDLFFYNPVNNSWKLVRAPGFPQPRSAHQAVSTPVNKGELWVFGGEFTSPSETLFYHFKDLWCLSLSEKRWEKVVVSNGPSPRSGHRMVVLGKKIIIFGGYSDNGRESRYFNDLHAFCLETRTWEKLAPAGRAPSPRSGCVMVPCGNDSVIVYGGYSRAREGRTERTVTHTDMFRLALKNGVWSWRSMGGGGRKPRAALASAVNVQTNKAYVFGGVTDVEETEDDIIGEMSDELSLLDLETGKWHNVTLKVEQQRPAPAPPQKTEEVAPDPVTVIEDGVFTVTLGGSSSSQAQDPKAEEEVGGGRGKGGPCARMAAMMAVHRGVLYVYGGILEKGIKQFHLGDMYSLDLHKLNDWKTLIKQPQLPTWLDSESESDSEDYSESEEESGGESDH